MIKGKRGKFISVIIFFILLTINMITVIGILNTPYGNEDEGENISGTNLNISYTLTFDEPELKQIKLYNEPFTEVYMPGSFNIGAIHGSPQIQIFPIKILLPYAKDIESINIKSDNSVEINTNSKGIDLINNPIAPYQPPIPIGMNAPESLIIDIDSYESTNPIPDNLYENLGINNCRGYSILTINLYPIQYTPSEGRLFYHQEITIEINLRDNENMNKFYRNNIDDKNWVETLVVNPDITDSYNDNSMFSSSFYPGGLCDPSDNGGLGYDYVIITRESLSDFTEIYNWSDFIDHKQLEGLDATLVTVEDIESNEFYWNSTAIFNDTAAKIREFCKDAYEDWEISYVLIAGDHEGAASIPRRLMETSYESNIESDIYWSNLDNTFNDDGDTYWGEAGDDGFDLYSELFIGNVPCDEPLDISNWITKSFYYADSLEKDYLDNNALYGGDTTWNCQGDDFMDFLFYGTDMWFGPIPDNDGPWPSFLGFLHGFDTWNTANPGMKFNNTVRWTAEPPNPGWFGGTETAAINGLKAAINSDNATIINAVAHANSDMSMDVSSSAWESNYHNTKPFFVFDFGCHCGDMSASSDGVLHSMLFHSDTELAFACVYNTGYGWGNLDSTNSSSALQQKLFWDFLLNFSKSGGTNNWQLGRAQAYSKDAMAPTINWDPSYGTWRSTIQGCLLFGDPAQLIKSPFQPDHEIIVSNLNVMNTIPHGETQNVKATITNIGKNNETNILVNFTVNNSVIDNTLLVELNQYQYEIVSFPWDPDYGTYLVCIEAQPVPEENFTYNNQMNKTVNVISAPIIWINPNDFNINQNADVVTISTLTIGNSNLAEDELDFNISFSGGYENWLSVSPSNGTIAIDSSTNIDVTINTTGLTEGDYQAIIVISSNDLHNPVINVPVNLSVVYATDVGASSVNYPTGIQPIGLHTINASVENFGTDDQYNIPVNVTVYEGGINGTVLIEDFSTNPVDWTITHISGTSWTWDSSDERMEHTYSSSVINSGYLDSPVLDCTSRTGTTLSFWHYWRADYSSGDQDGYVYGSIDGGSTFPYLIDEFHHNGPDEETAVKSYSIPWADNEPNVVIRFDVWNDNDWYWRIDDFDVSAEFMGDIAFTAETTVDVPAYQTRYVEFSPVWNETDPNVYGIIVTTNLSGDQDVSNDDTLDSVILFEDLPPTISGIKDLPDPQTVGRGGFVNISCNGLDDFTGIHSVFVDITGPGGFTPVNVSMTQLDADTFYYNADYTVVGNYSYFIWANDTVGHSVTSSTRSFRIMPDEDVTVDIELKTGWNLITIPIVNDWMASTLAENITGCQMIGWFDSTTQELKTHVVAAPAYDFPITNGMGYFVLVNTDSTFSLTGAMLTDGISVDTGVGWNMIGWFPYRTTSASSYAENMSGCQMVAWFDATTQELKTHVVAAPAYDFNVDCGMGLFMLTDTISSWYGEG